MVFLNSSSQKFICLLDADLVASVFSFLLSIKQPGTIYNCFLQVFVHKGAFFPIFFQKYLQIELNCQTACYQSITP